MSNGNLQGHLWRVSRADADTLRQLIAGIFTGQCWSFGGALLWDVSPRAGRANLRPVTSVTPASVVLDGDFGHAFAEEAEVRWKRRDDGAYDVLVLAEDQAIGAQRQGLALIAIYPEVVAMCEASALHLSTPEELKARRLRCRLDHYEYRAANGAVQFARYRKYREEPESAEGAPE